MPTADIHFPAVFEGDVTVTTHIHKASSYGRGHPRIDSTWGTLVPTTAEEIIHSGCHANDNIRDGNGDFLMSARVLKGLTSRLKESR